MLWSAAGIPLPVRDPISASDDPRPLIWSDVYVGFSIIRCGASPESRTVVDPWGAHGLRSCQRVVITMNVIEGSSEFAAGIARLEIYEPSGITARGLSGDILRCDRRVLRGV